jgi:hypothetical protein
MNVLRLISRVIGIETLRLTVTTRILCINKLKLSSCCFEKKKKMKVRKTCLSFMRRWGTGVKGVKISFNLGK